MLIKAKGHVETLLRCFAHRRILSHRASLVDREDRNDDGEQCVTFAFQEQAAPGQAIDARTGQSSDPLQPDRVYLMPK